MQPKNREKLDQRLKKNIENVAIKRPKEDDPEEETYPCPQCKAYTYASELECSNCKNSIPYCLASGKRMVLQEWTNCPSCKFPAILSSFMKLLQDDPSCPMCHENVNASALKLNPDPTGDLKAMLATEEEDDS